MAQYKKIRIGKTNTYLLQSEYSYYALIDSAVSKGGDQLINRLMRLGVTPELLKLIIITHTHYDHTGCLAQLQNWSHAQIICHQNAAENLSAGRSPTPRAANALLGKIISSIEKKNPDLSSYRPVYADITFTDQYDLSEWGIKGRLIFTPGHTSDSISVILESGIAFVGDTLFNILPCSVTPPFQEDHQSLYDSWQKLISTGARQFLPGHGSTIKLKKFQKLLKKSLK
jgi:glyoxylase-like metal-dependent hydrolase (beta-lactamase superfamily II)